MKFRSPIPFASCARPLMLSVSVVAVAIAATAAQAEDQYWLDGITVLATKLEERAIDSLAAVSAVREAQMRELAVNRPYQLFTGMPGVFTEATAQDPGTAVNIRGLQDHGRVAVIVDGARQNFARVGHNGSGSFYLEPELLAEVGVSRGPVSNIYGSGAIGGVVSFRTKDVDDLLLPDEQWGVATHGEIGSNRFSGLGSLFGAVRAGPNAEFVAGGTYRHLDDYKDGDGNRVPNSGQKIATGLAKATFRPTEGHEVKLGGIHYDADWVHRAISDTGTLSAIRDSQVTSSTATAKWTYSKPEDRLFDFSHSAYWNRVDLDTVATYVAPGLGGYYGAAGNRANYKIDTIGYDGHNTSRFDTGALRHELTLGGDIFEDDVANRDQGGFGAGYNPSGKRRVWGAFAQLRSRYSTWLEIISAVRYDNYALDGKDFTGAGVQSSGDRISPKLTVGLSPVEWFTFYGTYAEGYRAPSVTETLISGIHPTPAFTFLPNPNLKPEVGKNKELGINIERDDVVRPGDRWRVKANVFRNDVEDFIEGVTACRVIAPCYGQTGPLWANWDSQYQNVAKARIEGVELESSYDAGGWFVGLNAHRMRGKDMIEGDPLGKVPPDMVAATLGVRSVDRKWTASLRWAHYAAKKLKDLPNGTNASVATGAYNLVNLHLAYQPNENVIASLSVENLLNETYRIYMHELNSPGITVKGSLRMRFAGGAPAIEETRIVK